MELPNLLEVPRCQRSNPNAEVPLIPLLVGEHPRLISRTMEGSAMITNFRFCVFEKRLTINIPLLMIGDLLVNESTKRLRIGGKDAATYSCTFASFDDCQACTSMLREMLGGPKSIADLFAYRFYAAAMYQEKISHPLNGQLDEKANLLGRPADGTYAYNFYKEVERLGFDTSEHGLWRISQANENYELCPTYPKYHILPATVDDATLKVSLDFRALKRFPSVVWRDQNTGMVLIRSSQPLPSFLGVSYFTNHADIFLIEEIVNACNRDRLTRSMPQGTLKFTELEREASSQYRQENGHLVYLHSLTNGDTGQDVYHLPVAGKLLGAICDVGERCNKKLAIVDCRSLAGVWGNSFKGGGTEDEIMYKCDTEHLDLANIHTVRDSFYKLKAACHAHLEATFQKNLANSLWLSYISALLRGANIVVELMYVKQRPVLVHCSDGWDRTSQIVSLSELMMDPYYRTLEGFQVLVEKEWLHFGHKFAERGGHDPKCCDSSQASPIFLQFLDCVYQLTRQYPAIFQFNELYLVKLLRHSQACLFGTFLHNCQKDREKLQHLTASVWSLLTLERGEFINPLYQRTNQVLKARCREEEMCFWKTVYLAGSSQCAEMDFYSDGLTVLGIESGQRSVDGLPKSRSFDSLPKNTSCCGRSNSEPSISAPGQNTTTRETTIELKTASSKEPAEGGLSMDETDLSYEPTVGDPSISFDSSLNNVPAVGRLNMELTSVSSFEPLKRDLNNVLESSLSPDQTSARSNLELESISSHEQSSANLNLELESISSYDITSADLTMDLKSVSSFEQTSAGSNLEFGFVSSREHPLGDSSMDLMMTKSHKPTMQYSRMELNTYPCDVLISADLALDLETVLSCEPSKKGLTTMLETVDHELSLGDTARRLETSHRVSSLNRGSKEPAESLELTTTESLTGHEAGSSGASGFLQNEPSVSEALAEATDDIHTLTICDTDCLTGSPTPKVYYKIIEIVSPSQLVSNDEAEKDDISLSLDTSVQTSTKKRSIESLCDHTQPMCAYTSPLLLNGDSRTTVPSRLGGDGQVAVSFSLGNNSEVAVPPRLGCDGKDVSSSLDLDGQAAVPSSLDINGQATVPFSLVGDIQAAIPSSLGYDDQAAIPSSLGCDDQAAIPSSLRCDDQAAVPSGLVSDCQAAIPSSLGGNSQAAAPSSLSCNNQAFASSRLGDNCQVPILSGGSATRFPARRSDIKACVDGAVCHKCLCCSNSDFDSLKINPEVLSCSQAEQNYSPVFNKNETPNSLDKNCSRLEDEFLATHAWLICSRCSGFKTYRGETGVERFDLKIKKYHRNGCCHHAWESPSRLDKSTCSLRAGHVTLGMTKAYQSGLNEFCEGIHRVDETIDSERKGVSLDNGGSLDDEDSVGKINISLGGTTIEEISNVEPYYRMKDYSAGCESCELVSAPAGQCCCPRQEVSNEAIVLTTAAAGSCHSSVEISGSFSCCRWRSNVGRRQQTSETGELRFSGVDYRTQTVETKNHQVSNGEHRQQATDGDYQSCSDYGYRSTVMEDKMGSIRLSANNSDSHTAQASEEGETDQLVMSENPALEATMVTANQVDPEYPALEASLVTANQVEPARGAWVSDSTWCQRQDGIFLNHQHHCCCCHRESCPQFYNLQTPATCHQQHLNHLATVRSVSQLKAAHQPGCPMNLPGMVCHRCPYQFSSATSSDGRISSAVAD